MSTTLLTFSLSFLAVILIVVKIGLISLLVGAFHFLFGGPKLVILKTQENEGGFAFALKWNEARTPGNFDKIRVRLFAPFNSPSQVEARATFDKSSTSFARDVSLGNGMKKIFELKGTKQARVMIELITLKEDLTFQFEMKLEKFFSKIEQACQTAGEFNQEYQGPQEKPLYHQPKKDFISGPLPKSPKLLKLASNPMISVAAPAGGTESSASQENFNVSKVWIEPGCIVCDACENIYEEVFEVTADTCIIRPNAPLTDGLRIQEAAEACPVEVIKFNRA